MSDHNPAAEPASARVDLSELARTLTDKERTYARLADDCWEHHDYLTAIRHRGMAEAYRDAVHDVAAFAQGRVRNA